MSFLQANTTPKNRSSYYSLSLFVTVKEAGQRVTRELTNTYGVSSVVTMNSINKIPTAKLVLLDGSVSEQRFSASQSNDFNPGNELSIKIRHDDFEDVLFAGIIIKQKVKQLANGNTQLCLELKDVAVKLTAERKNSLFADKTDIEIIKNIAEQYADPIAGLKKVEVPAEQNAERSQKHREMVQYFCTDWDFLVSRADAVGRLVFTENGILRVAEPDFLQQPIANLSFGGNIYEFDLELNAVGQYDKVTARCFDSGTGEIVSEDVSRADSTKQGNLSSSDLSEVLGVTDFPLQHSGQLGNAELKSWAYSKLMRSHLEKIRGTLKIDGWEKIKPGVLIDLGKISDKFNGIAFVSGVMNQFTSNSGWYTELQIGFSQEWFAELYDDIVQEPASGLLPAVNGLVIGQVLSVEAEDGNDSNYWVKVKIPLVNDTDNGVWARVAGTGLGENRGVYFKPEVGDDVILGFLNDDPRQPIVLGSIYSHLAPPEMTDESDDSSSEITGFFARNNMNLTFDEATDTVTIVTPEEQKVILSDKEDSSGAYIRIEDAHGNTITMDKDGISVYSSKDLSFEAKQNINLKGANISLDSTGTFEAAGRTGAKLNSSGGNTEVSGTLVMIN